MHCKAMRECQAAPCLLCLLPAMTAS
jgi:hypothetical protein